MALACALLASVPAAAQPIGGENGIKVGEGRLHPYVDLDLRFDSAALAHAGALYGDMVNHVRPGFRLEVPGSNLFLQLAANADYVWYTGMITSTSARASHLEGGMNLDLAFNQAGAVEFRVQDQFARTERSTNPLVSTGVISLFNEARVAMPIHPGGHALEITPGASFTVEYFDPLIPSRLAGDTGQFNYTELGFQLNGRYRFLPKTALVVDADFAMPTFRTGTELLLNASAGISGLLSQKVAVVAKAGWGHAFTTEDSTFVGHLELAYLASQTATAKIGYMRTLQPVANLRTFRDDRVYTEARALLGGRLTLHAYGGLDFIDYAGDAGVDTNVRLDLGPEFQFTRWLMGAAGYVLTLRSSTVTVPYTRHEAYARFTLAY